MWRVAIFKSIFGGLWVKKYWNASVVSYLLRSGIAGLWDMNVQLYKMIPNCFLKWLYQLILWRVVLSIYISWSAVCTSYSWFIFSPTHATIRLFNIYQSNGYDRMCIVVLICILWLLMSLSIFSYVSEPSIYLFWNTWTYLLPIFLLGCLLKLINW